tara:strand:+ start:1225 stop:1599 length:375 start_codon:yes stop_codon:yes gene_type:complete
MPDPEIEDTTQQEREAFRQMYSLIFTAMGGSEFTGEGLSESQKTKTLDKIQLTAYRIATAVSVYIEACTKRTTQVPYQPLRGEAEIFGNCCVSIYPTNFDEIISAREGIATGRVSVAPGMDVAL